MLYIETILETMPYGKSKAVKVKALEEYNQYNLCIDTFDVGDTRVQKQNSRNIKEPDDPLKLVIVRDI